MDGPTTNAPTTTPGAENPWGKETLTVAVESEILDRNYTALARPALAYWNEHRTTTWTGHGTPPRLRLTGDAASADVVVHYQPTIARCAGTTTDREAGFFHCSPTVTANETVDGQVDVTVTSRYTNQTTTDLTVNALAGLYGVTDPDQPRSVDAPRLLDPFPRTDTVTVGITYVAGDDRTITPLVRDAVEYWEATDDRYGDYQTDWVVDPDAERPDVEVLLVDTIVACGFGPRHEYYIGCTNLLSTATSANTPVQVEIATGYTNDSTRRTITHEFGHLYGREHGEEPMPLMSATGEAVPRNESKNND